MTECEKALIEFVNKRYGTDEAAGAHAIGFYGAWEIQEKKFKKINDDYIKLQHDHSHLSCAFKELRSRLEDADEEYFDKHAFTKAVRAAEYRKLFKDNPE
jgi:hypothetical protein